MTDHHSAAPGAATIIIGSGTTLAEAVELAVSVDDGGSEVVVLPSSLRRTDRVAAAVREHLRLNRIVSRLALPTNPIAGLMRLGSGRAGSAWTTITIEPPDSPPRSIRLPRRLCSGHPFFVVTDVNAVSGKGPYVLDLLARYIHPLSRLHDLATRGRADAAVDVNLALTSSLFVVARRFEDFTIVGAASDPVAAELFALALADEDVPADRGVIGPWEDRVIQRATELELGARIPRDISFALRGAPNNPVREAFERISCRIGVVPP